MMFFTLRADNPGGNNSEKVLAILEVMVLIFITTFIPSLIDLGRPPENLSEIWSELLVAILACAYAYMRMRGIDVTPEPE